VFTRKRRDLPRKNRYYPKQGGIYLKKEVLPKKAGIYRNKQGYICINEGFNWKKGRDLPGKRRDLPVKRRSLPAKRKNLTAKRRELPAKRRYLPEKRREKQAGFTFKKGGNDEILTFKNQNLRWIYLK
jgi:hypothetical protein